MFEGLEKLSEDKFTMYIFCTLSLIIPGVGHLYLNHREFFLTLPLFRTILLAILYSIPLFFISSLEIFIIDSQDDKQDKKYSELGIISIITIIIFLLSVFIYHSLNIKFLPFLIILYILAPIILFLIIKSTRWCFSKD